VQKPFKHVAMYHAFVLYSINAVILLLVNNRLCDCIVLNFNICSC